MEASDPEKAAMLKTPESATLCFYIFELLCRFGHYRWHLICGPPSFVAWSVLDIVVILVGVLQFLTSSHLLPTLPDGFEDALKSLMLLRLLRAVKIIRIFLESDLSR